MPRRSWLLLPEGHPVGCLCPQEVPLNQPCSADMERTSQQVRDQLNITPESAMLGNMWAKSEEEQQHVKLEDCSGSAHFLDEEILAGQSFEEYMAIFDSFSTQQGNEEEENRGNLENSSFLEYLEELCSHEKRVGEAEFKPDTEFLDSFLSSDPELIGLLALEKQEQEVTLKTENVAPAPKSDPDPIDLLSMSELVQEVILEKLSYLRHDHSVTEDKYPTTSRVEETSPPQNSQAFYLVPPCSQSDIDPNHCGETSTQRTIEQKGVLPTFSPLVPSHFLGNSSFLEYLDELCCDETFVREVEFTLDTKFLDSLLSSDPDPIDLLALEKQKVDNPNCNREYTRQRNVEPKEHLTTCSPLIPSHLLEEQLSTDYPVSATSALNHNGSLFMNFPSPQLHAKVSPETSLASDLETRDNNALVEVHAAKWYESIEDAMFFLNLTDPESAQLFLESPLRGHHLAPESTSTSSVSGSNEDPCTVGVKESTPSLRDDALTFSPPAVSVLALKTQHQIKESQEQLSPKNIDLKSSCIEAVSVQANSPLVTDSQAVDGKLSDSVPEEQAEPTVFVVSEDVASPELRTGHQEETERQDVADTLKETATKSREDRKEKNTKSKTKLKVMTNTRPSQRQSGRIGKERPSGEVSKEGAVEKGDKKTAKCTPEMQRLVYVTQKRRSFVGRELLKLLSQATEPEDTDTCSETGEKEQQKLNMEGGEQHWVDNLDMSTETGAENALLDKMPQVEKHLGNETKEKEIKMSSFVKRQTRSMKTEEKVLMTPLPATPVRSEVKNLETERNQMKSSSKRDILDGDDLEVNAKADETEPPTLLVSSPLKRSRNRSDEEVFRTNEDNVSLPESSLQSPTVQTHPHDIQDLIKDDQSRQAVPKEGLLSRINEPPSEKTCKENQNVTSPEAEQQQRTADGRSEVPGTSDVYSLRSHHVSESSTGIQENNVTNEQTSVKLTSDVKGEDGRRNGEEYPSSRMKRHRNEQGSSEEREAIQETDDVAIETEMSSLSPTKRGRWKSGAKEHAEREEQQTLTANEKVKEGSTEKSANKPSPPSTRSSAKKDGERSRVSTGEDTFKGDSRRRSFVGRELLKLLSQATEPEDTDTCSETGEKEQQKLNMEGGEQHWVDNLDMSTETGAENALLDKMPQVEKNFGNETKEKEIQNVQFCKETD
ncbi:hypothetical protein OYC64_004136 [Pagothenia borchgrevinki]|uniref:Nuclear Testis protein N-terminal domain-containing protein n=1 Tax=Pagothenia borchgrevinki TaxID=8213 RepID=A0ABD2FWI5_PAGBO